MIGTTLSHYRITAALGAGGMGEVYRATDTKLGRDVAIKVLPKEVAEDPERLARFQREAHLLASLNHPNIAAIHGLEEADGKPFLALELVEGEDLKERLSQGALPVDEALEVAKQIAEALEEAHNKGIVHRDLKPANVKLTPDGKAKVLDFGLAKAWAGEAADGSSASAALSQSPTLANTGTQAGMILGTAAYMSPEQARGRLVDRRADVWAFGVLLYEMLTGEQLFSGETVTDVFAAVITREPDWESLPRETPRAVRRLLRRCLRRDQRARLPDIGAARLELQDVLAGLEEERDVPADPTMAPSARKGATGLAWIPWLVVLLAVAAAVWGWITRSPAPTSEVRRFTVLAPQLSGLRAGDGSAILLTRDGRHLVTRGIGGGEDVLFHRRLDTREIRALEGTDRSQFPFLSPDGEWVGFFRSREVHKVSLLTGAQVRIATLPQPGTNASWSERGFILATTGSSLLRIPEEGGEPEELLGPKKGAVSRYMQVEALPGHDAALVTELRGDGEHIAVLDLESRSLTDLGLRGADATYVVGHIVYGNEGRVWAAPFDPGRRAIRGAPIPTTEPVWIDANSDLHLAVSEDGTLAYLPAPAIAKDPLVWVSRTGDVEPALSTPERFAAVEDVRLSDDGHRVVLTDDQQAIWILDLDTETPSLVNDASYSFYPVWTHGSTRIAFASDREGLYGIEKRRVGYAEEPVSLLQGENPLRTVSWSATDGALLVREETPETGMDILVHRDGQDELEPLLTGPGNQLSAVVSPDGRWLAYVSGESGQDQVYVTAYPQPERRVQVSNRGGREPMWSPRGGELFYREGGKLMAVRYTGGDGFSIARRDTLFEASFSRYRWHAQYDIHPDGDRFLMVQAPRGRGEIFIVENWTRALARLTATGG